MAYGKVSDYLSPEDIAAFQRDRPKTAETLGDPFGMGLEDYINAYRQNQQGVIANPTGQGLSPDQMSANSWFGGMAGRMGLPTDASNLFSMPGQDWQSLSLQQSGLQQPGGMPGTTETTPGGLDPMNPAIAGNFDLNSLLGQGGGASGGAGDPTTNGMMRDRRWNVDISPGGVSGGPQTQTPGSQDNILRNVGGGGGTGTGGGFNAGPSRFPTGTSTAGSGYGRLPLTNSGSDPFGDLFGLDAFPGIRDIDLGDMPTMSGDWAPGFEDAYRQNTEGTRRGIEDIYNGLQMPTARGNEIDINSLPSFRTEQVGQSDALKQLLSGQGFAPDVMARINAGSTDAISRQAGANRGSARLALEQSGLAGSPAQAAMEGQINRQRGDAATQQLNQNAIANADRGLENFRMGAGMDFSREQGNMQQANAMALAKASQMLSAMQQNSSNMQQANMANFGAQTDRQMTSGNRQADVVSGSGREFGTASIQNQQNANQTNAANRFNWRLNQAQLDRDADTGNAGMQQGRWNTGVNGLLGLAGMQNPAGFSNQANQLTSQRQPTNLLGSVLTNIGRANTPVTS